MKNIFIGVDGGATKCKIRVEDEEGNLIGEGIGGPANIRLSVDLSWESIYNTLIPILNKNNLNLEDKKNHYHIGLGLAGCEVEAAKKEFLSASHSFTNLLLTSDAHTACIGAHAGSDGAIIIIGTGVIGYQIQNGNTSRVGGWGFPHDDTGGGAWLGLEASRFTFQWLDRRLEHSFLLEEIFQFFNQDLNYFIEWTNQANSNDFAKLAPIVIKHYQRKEPLAVKLLRSAAEAVNQIAHGLENFQEKNTDLPYCLFGGISPFVQPLLADSLKEKIIIKKAEADSGAIMLLKSGMTILDV